MIRKTRKFLVYRLLHINDTPHRIALGAAIGVFVGWTPTIGFHMALTVLLAYLLRANKLVGLAFAWLSNPLTLIPVYGPSFILGNWLLGREFHWSDFIQIISKPANTSWIEHIHAWWTTTWSILTQLWLGSVIVGLILGSVAYSTTYFAVVKLRSALAHRRSVRLARRALLVVNKPVTGQESLPGSPHRKAE